MPPERKILVIDDDPLVCEIITSCLEDWIGTVVDCATTGGIGAQKIRSGIFNLAIIDALLPEVLGVTLAEMAVHQNTPTLLLAGHPETIEEFEVAQCPYLSKPFPLSALMEEARRAVIAPAENVRRVKESLVVMKTRSGALPAVNISREL